MINIKFVESSQKPVSNPVPDPHLRQQWTKERAYRSGLTIGRTVFALTGFAFVLNLFFAGPIEVAADGVLLIGCALSLYLTNKNKAARYFVWWPLYFGFLLAIIPSTWLSGGIYSPWLGLYLGTIAIIGAVVQVQITPLQNIFLLVIYTFGWYLASLALPHPDAIDYVNSFPEHFMFLGASTCLLGIGYGLHGLIKAERDLAQEIEKKYSELFQTKATLLQEENANQAKSAFLANISHELRTPLGAILGYAHLLQGDQTSESEKALFAVTIERNGQQLARLVDDLLDLSKVEAGRIELESLDSSLPEMIHEVLNLLSLSAKKKNVEMPVHFLTPVPKNLRTDPVRFKQILTNILGNALKFTDEGSVDLSLQFVEKPTPELIVRVKDTGRGISELERQKLFKPFSQADASMSRKYGGTGLGLNFSRELVRLLGGELDLTWSEIGKGSEFTIRIPIEVPPDTPFLTNFTGSSEERVILHPNMKNFNFEGLKVLVADDAQENRDIVRRYLSPTGAIIDEATNGTECVNKVEAKAYDMVLMDIQMPGMDGLQATSLLRKNHFVGPIIAVTAHAMKHDRDICLKAGCDEHIAKPLKKLELMETIEKFKNIPLRYYEPLDSVT